MDDDISFFSNLSTPVDQMQNKSPKGPNYLREVDHPLVIPIHKKVRFLITSNDVNHAWWVPDFAVKRDAVSGFINEAWTKVDKPGTYYGQCAELCGVNHAFMPIVVIAKSEQGYKDWIAQQKGQASQGELDSQRTWSKEELMTKGEGVYNHVCAACHQPGGVGLAPTFPALKGDPVTTGPIEGHINVVFNGKTGTAMQAFKGQLTDAEIAAIVTYERNSWGNNKGDMVQPASIKALRDGKSMQEAMATKPSAAAAKPSDKPTPPPAGPEGGKAADTKPADAKPADATTPAAAPAAAAATAPESPADAMKSALKRGEQVYQTTCAVCHQQTGLGLPPTFPALKGGKIATGPLDGHIHQVVFGKVGTAMQAFMGQLTDQQIADVVTYERNSWGNNKGDLATPDMVKAMREKGDKK
jgi:cytochrome c oxidase subunit 2